MPSNFLTFLRGKSGRRDGQGARKKGRKGREKREPPPTPRVREGRERKKSHWPGSTPLPNQKKKRKEGGGQLRWWSFFHILRRCKGGGEGGEGGKAYASANYFVVRRRLYERREKKISFRAGWLCRRINTASRCRICRRERGRKKERDSNPVEKHIPTSTGRRLLPEEKRKR